RDFLAQRLQVGSGCVAGPERIGGGERRDRADKGGDDGRRDQSQSAAGGRRGLARRRCSGARGRGALGGIRLRLGGAGAVVGLVHAGAQDRGVRLRVGFAGGGGVLGSRVL